MPDFHFYTAFYTLSTIAFYLTYKNRHNPNLAHTMLAMAFLLNTGLYALAVLLSLN